MAAVSAITGRGCIDVPSPSRAPDQKSKIKNQKSKIKNQKSKIQTLKPKAQPHIQEFAAAPLHPSP
jgi:hypothetical protein